MLDNIDSNRSGDRARIASLFKTSSIFNRILELRTQKSPTAISLKAFGLVQAQPRIACIVADLGIAPCSTGRLGLVLGVDGRRQGNARNAGVAVLEDGAAGWIADFLQLGAGCDLLAAQGIGLGLIELEGINRHLVEIVAEGVQLNLLTRGKALDRHRPLALAHAHLEVGRIRRCGSCPEQNRLLARCITEQLHAGGVAGRVFQLPQVEGGAVGDAGEACGQRAGVGGGEVGRGGGTDRQGDAGEEGGGHQSAIGQGGGQLHSVPAVAAGDDPFGEA